jgi:hypothetical protein
MGPEKQSGGNFIDLAVPFGLMIAAKALQENVLPKSKPVKSQKGGFHCALCESVSLSGGKSQKTAPKVKVTKASSAKASPVTSQKKTKSITTRKTVKSALQTELNQITKSLQSLLKVV